jgi:hypothetical protein
MRILRSTGAGPATVSPNWTALEAGELPVFADTPCASAISRSQFKAEK